MLIVNASIIIINTHGRFAIAFLSLTMNVSIMGIYNKINLLIQYRPMRKSFKVAKKN